MHNKAKISAAIVALLLLVTLAVNIAAASTSLPIAASNAVSVKTEISAAAISPSNINPTATANVQTRTQTDNADEAEPVTANNMEKLRERIPKTFEEADASILPVRNRYLMYTRDGAHIMWGYYGNNIFTGTDNNGKRCWGIYGNGVFAGFYDGEFFWGSYNNGQWKAEYLFGLRYSRGSYVLFPVPTVSSVAP
jgi:hypothetical protein